MWYVIQTKTGEEDKIVQLIDGLKARDQESSCFVPVFEKVIRNSQSCRVYLRRMFPGYLIVDTDDPAGMFHTLKRVPEFTRMLGADEEESGETIFVPIGEDDRRFLETLLIDGVLHVSYVTLNKSRVDKVIGPLADYVGHIRHLDIQHRRAIVEKEIFGKRRKIYFGLWTPDDPPHAWVRQQIEGGDTGIITNQTYDIGIYEGDRVRGTNGMYEENEMRVIKVDPVRRRVIVEIELFGRTLSLPLYADDVVKVNKGRDSSF
ncbi:MAG: hypothetical protein K6E81_03395 [Lachnospiraceae bacterium]|nr:hypothetical protein [Lachnospiraceae bacterium]